MDKEDVNQLISFAGLEGNFGLQTKILKREPQVWEDDQWVKLIRGSIFLIVGTWEGAELFDRPIAYRIANELAREGFSPLVITDRYLWEAGEKYGYRLPIISVGGPKANSFSRKLAQNLELKEEKVSGVRKVEGRLVGYLWGEDARSTLKMARRFTASHLPRFVKEATQEPKVQQRQGSSVEMKESANNHRNKDLAAQLDHLGSLHSSGKLTEEEFRQAKQKLLGNQEGAETLTCPKCQATDVKTTGGGIYICNRCGYSSVNPKEWAKGESRGFIRRWLDLL